MKAWNNRNASARKKARTKVVREFCLDYCSNTTIHGVRYFTERRRHWTEKCWWMIAIVVSIWFCCASIQTIWMKWCDSPATMIINEKEMPISMIPFPTVTVCPQIKTYKSQLDIASIFTGRVDWQNLSEIEQTRAKILAHICVEFWKHIENTYQDLVNASVLNYVIEDLAPPLGQTLHACMWQNQNLLKNCSELFVPIVTEEGLCFSFNALNSNDIYTEEMAPDMMRIKNRPNSSEWSLEAGYKDRSNKIASHSYPMQSYTTKKRAALGFTLISRDIDVEYVCRSAVVGFKIYLHTPGTVLKVADFAIHVPFTEEVRIAIKPKFVTTSDGLRSYGPNQRQCFFNSERQLRFFKWYSKENCELECLANYTLQRCGCVKFSMPRNADTHICGVSNIQCYSDAEDELFEQDLINGMTNETAKIFRQNCNCMQACTMIAYEAEIDRVKFNWNEAREATHDQHFGENLTLLASRLKIFFKHHEIVMYRREEQYTYTDFLAICGGLLGLCLGVSALSVVEFVYYFTLRIYWSLRRWNCENIIIPLKPSRINYIHIDMPDL